MAEPGDPHATDDLDDLIGFATPASLQGRTRAPEPIAAAAPEARPDDREPDLFDQRPAPAPALTRPESDMLTDPRPRPVEAGSIFEPSAAFRDRPARRAEPKPITGGGMSLYAVYALILFAVPTLGVSAVIGLLAVTGRDGPDEPAAQSHFIYQQRTLWTAAVAAAAGIILLAAPFALGVPVLFAAALWTLARGAAGVWALQQGRPITDPRGWWIQY